jgi:hypothetical protein
MYVLALTPTFAVSTNARAERADVVNVFVEHNQHVEHTEYDVAHDDVSHDDIACADTSVR